MYLAFFGLREKPFNLTPDPKFLYLNAAYREALAALRYGITERRGFISLVGEAGTGKTTLLRCLLAELGPQVRTVLILNPAVSFEELLVFILTDLGRPPMPATPKLELLQALNGELLDALARGGNVVVLIDEAQDLAIPVLEELRLLSNLETANEKIVQFVLAGQPELDVMLVRPELRQLRQRIAVPARLRPLARRELGDYVAARIAAAGGDPRGLFTRAALLRLWRFSRGLPRLVNVACDNALVCAYASGARTIGGRLMGDVLRDLRRGEVGAPPRFARTRVATVGVAAVVGALIGLGASWLSGQASADRSSAGGVGHRAASEHTEGFEARAPATSGQAPAGVVARQALDAPPPARLAAEAPPPESAAIGAQQAGPRAPEAVAAAPAGAAVGAEHRIEGGGPPSVRGSEGEAVAAPRQAAPVPAGQAPAGSPRRAGAPEGGIGTSAQPQMAKGVAEAARPAVVPGSETVNVVGAVPPEGMEVLIVEGDDLTHIARRYYGYTSRELLEEIQRANPSLVNLDLVPAGQRIMLPGDPAARQSSTAPTGADAAPADRGESP